MFRTSVFTVRQCFTATYICTFGKYLFKCFFCFLARSTVILLINTTSNDFLKRGQRSDLTCRIKRFLNPFHSSCASSQSMFFPLRKKTSAPLLCYSFHVKNATQFSGDGCSNSIQANLFSGSHCLQAAVVSSSWSSSVLSQSGLKQPLLALLLPASVSVKKGSRLVM